MVDAVSDVIEDVVRPATLANWDASNAAVSPESREGVRISDALDQIRAAPPMPTIPAAVLSADKPWRTDLLTQEANPVEQVTFADWLAGQRLLAATLGVEQIADTDSGHDVYLYSPQLVTDTIGSVVAEVRNSTG